MTPKPAALLIRYCGLPSWPRVALRLKPSCLTTLRCTSTMRTFSITCSLPAMVSMLSTPSGLAANCWAISTARSASAALATMPERTRPLFTASTFTFEPGSRWAMVWATAL